MRIAHILISGKVQKEIGQRLHLMQNKALENHPVTDPPSRQAPRNNVDFEHQVNFDLTRNSQHDVHLDCGQPICSIQDQNYDLLGDLDSDLWMSSIVDPKL